MALLFECRQWRRTECLTPPTLLEIAILRQQSAAKRRRVGHAADGLSFAEAKAEGFVAIGVSSGQPLRST